MRDWTERPFHKGVTLILGVVAEHDAEQAEELLDDMTARIMSMPDMPLMVTGMSDDCLVAPPERGSHHIEIRWIVV